MKQFSPINTLIFDFGGVLINLDLPKCIENIKELGFEDVDIYLSNFGQKDFFLQFEKGEIDTIKFRDEIRKKAKKHITDEQIDYAWCSFLCDIPFEKLQLLLHLRKKYRLLLLSNSNPLHVDVCSAREFGKMDGKTVYDFFDKCYFSYQLGLTKPDPKIFETLAADAAVQPNECLFLDDGSKNIDTAVSLGFNTYLVEPEENLDFLLSLDKDTK